MKNYLFLIVGDASLPEGNVASLFERVFGLGILLVVILIIVVIIRKRKN